MTETRDTPTPNPGANDVIAAGTASARKRTRNLAARIGADLDRLHEQVQAEQRIAALEAELREAKASLNRPDRADQAETADADPS